jgi:aconitase B
MYIYTCIYIYISIPSSGGLAADGLSQTLLMFEAFYDVETKAKAGNKNAIR